MHLHIICFFFVLCLASVIPNIISSEEKITSDKLENEEWQNRIYNDTLNDWERNSTGSYNFSRYRYSTEHEFYNFTFYRNSTRDYNDTVPYLISTSSPYNLTNYNFTYRPYPTGWPVSWPYYNFTTRRPVSWPYYTTRRPVSWPYYNFTTRRPVSWPYYTTGRWPYYTTGRWPYYTTGRWPTRTPFRLSLELLAKFNLTIHK